MFDRRHYAVKEHVGMLKLHDQYDIFDMDTNEKLGMAIENVGVMKQLLRLVVNKKMLPTTIEFKPGDENGPVVLTIKRGLTFLRAKVDVLDAAGTAIGYFKSKLMSIGGGFYVYDTADQQIAEVKGDWKGWNFQFLGSGGQVLGTVSKKWAGTMKEMFTSADTYFINLSDEVPTHGALNSLLLAAGLAIDIVLKETSS